MCRRSVAPHPARRGLVVLLLLAASACSVLPDELNLSPLYRHRIDPSGHIVELDLLWPLVYWQKDEVGTTDFRLRPLWRTERHGSGSRTEHQFLVPLGQARSDPYGTLARFFPLFYLREHLHEGEPGAWDHDWWAGLLLWGGSSAAGEDYLALFPIYGVTRNFLSYERLGFLLWPLHMWTEKRGATGTHWLWPLIGWGGDPDKPTRSRWWRFLPFYGESIEAGERESYTTLWPLFHWGRDRLDTPHPYTNFMFFPFFGWQSGGAFLSWTVLWPFIRHSHKVAGIDDEPGKDFVRWDLPWPLVRWQRDSWSVDEEDQTWLMPLFATTSTRRQESAVFLFPLLWFRQFWDRISYWSQTYLLPVFWESRIRYRKTEGIGSRDRTTDPAAFETAEDLNRRLFPLVDWSERRDGSWHVRGLDPWPFDYSRARGVREAYDWIWTVAEKEGDARGNTRVRTFANLYSSRNFAGRRFQSSVPFLFNYEATEDGRRTLRLFQILPIRWGG